MYKLRELPEVEQKKKFEDFCDRDLIPVNLSYEIEFLKETLQHLGLDVEKTYYDLSYCQGSGACFEGYYSYNSGWKKQLESLGYEPDNAFYLELVELGLLFQSVQRPYFYQLEAKIVHRGHYYHENSMSVEVYDKRDSRCWTIGGDGEDGLVEAIKETALLIKSHLQKEYDYQNSFDCFLENFADVEFDSEEEGE